MSNASYYNIKNVPSQLQSVDVVNLNVADTVTASVLNSEVSSGLVPFTVVPAGKQLHKVTLYTGGDSAWRTNSDTPMVTEKGGTVAFEFPKNAFVVAAHLEAYTLATGSVSFTLKAGSAVLLASALLADVNLVDIGVQVSSYGNDNRIGGDGSVNILTVNQGDKVTITSNTANTAGDLFACVYYYL